MDHWIYEKTKDGEIVYDVYSKLLKDRIIFLSEELDSEVASKTIALLLYLNAESRTKEIKIYINSVGGNIDSFFAIYDTMQQISAPVKTICVGEACSAASVILAAGSAGKRLAYPHSMVMIHNLQISDMEGSKAEIKDQVKLIDKLSAKFIEILARHTGQPLAKVRKDCEKDKYLTAEEALEYGIIDKILTPKKKIPPLRKIKK
jgi:ATP-dependent Clp protease, protease subunit